MANSILTISKWEITRLRLRFSGRSRFVIMFMILLAIITSYLVYHQGMLIGKELYTVGISQGGPSITDPRFKVIAIDPHNGHDMLSRHVLDAYIDGNSIISRDDKRSQYVSEALQEYLSTQELLRMTEQYELNRVFPLRIEVVNLDTPEIERPQSQPSATTETPLISDQKPPPEPSVTNGPNAGVSDANVKRQLEAFQNGGLSKLKEVLLSEPEIIVPSLTPLPLPLAQVTLSFSYVLPLLLAGVFLASSFTEERVSRKLVVLLSTPVSRLQIILGKILPYLAYSWITVIAITLALGGNIWLSLVIFTPIILIIFSAYMVVALTYRTFKDLTFFTVLVLTIIMTYLVVPALLTGVSDLSHISPLTLVVEMYRGDTITAKEYFLASIPLYLIFLQALFVGTRLFNEEYLMGFKPLHIKMAEALNLAIDKSHLNLSAFLSSLFLLPFVFIIELMVIVFVHNIRLPVALAILIIASVTIEELAKSAVVLVLLKNKNVQKKIAVIKLSTLSAIGFFSGEKLLLFLALSVLAPSTLVSAVFGSGLLILPFVVHVVSTCVVGVMTVRLGTKYYPLALIMGSVIHVAYNLYAIGMLKLF